MISQAHTLVIGYGNPGRVDDGLGPAFANRVDIAALPGVRVFSDYQLQIEYALTLTEHEVVLFADASTSGELLVSLRRLLPSRVENVHSHSLRPETVVALAQEIFGWKGKAYLLGLRGAEFNKYGEWLSPTGVAALDLASVYVIDALREGRLAEAVTDGETDNSGVLCREDISCKMVSM